MKKFRVVLQRVNELKFVCVCLCVPCKHGRHVK